MAVIVTLRYFSGIKNPQWPLSPAEVAELRRRFAGLPPLAALKAERPRPRMGYKGTVVTSTEGEGLDLLARMGIVTTDAKDRPTFVDDKRQFEQWLVDATMPESVRKFYALNFATATATETAPAVPIQGISGTGKVGGKVCGAAPAYPGDVLPWTDLSKGNNCYSYANDEPASQILPPAPGINDNNFVATALALKNGAKQDKLLAASPLKKLPNACPKPDGSHYLAICMREQIGQAADFHCIRLDYDGCWTHMDSSPPLKQGDLAVRNTDDDGNVITDLRQARFVLPMKLVGFFKSRPGIRIIEQ